MTNDQSVSNVSARFRRSREGEERDLVTSHPRWSLEVTRRRLSRRGVEWLESRYGLLQLQWGKLSARIRVDLRRNGEKVTSDLNESTEFSLFLE